MIEDTLSITSDSGATDTFISGWYAILPSKALTQQQTPMAIERFGIPLVLWRQKNGEPVALLDQCPHRAAKLSLGAIVDDTVRCPFHGFQFAADGRCSLAPEYNKALPGLKARTFLIQEALDMIWLYWGGSEPTSFTINSLAEIHDRFSGYYSSLEANWASHITYCIENQLDYTHLRFVHHNTIGRHFVMPENPEEICGQDRITVYLKSKEFPAMTYYFPNAWTLRISQRMQFILFFVPVNASQTLLYLRAYRNFFTMPLVRQAMDWAMNWSNRIILRQDQAIVASQGKNPSYLAENDLLMRYDKAIRYFRKHWCEKLKKGNQHDNLFKK